MNLYWRMALTIGAALLAFVLLGIGSVVFVASAQLQSYIATRHSDLGEQAAAVLQREGRPGLEHWLKTAALPRDVTIFILDEEARDILGRPLPAELTDFVRTWAVQPVEPADASYRPVRLAPQLVGPRGEAYAFLPLPNQIRVWGSSATVLGLVLVALLVIATVAWIIARTVGRPLNQLQQAVRELASGRTGARAPATLARRADELGALAADFNTMADQLEAVLAGRAQLMAELSHELRSPLARLQAALALADHRQALPAPERERMEQEIRRLDAVIGDLLRFSRLGAAPAMSRRLLRLRELLESLRRDEEIEAAPHGISLVLAGGGDLAVVGDPELLRSGLENILRNAIRYAPGGSAVELAGTEEGNEVVLTVADRGPGVPAEFLDRIFEPYFRVPAGDGQGDGGTGLGLAIARRVFEVHGGHVGAAPRPGGGLVVTARLPAADLR